MYLDIGGKVRALRTVVHHDMGVIINVCRVRSSSRGFGGEGYGVLWPRIQGSG